MWFNCIFVSFVYRIRYAGYTLPLRSFFDIFCHFRVGNSDFFFTTKFSTDVLPEVEQNFENFSAHFKIQRPSSSYQILHIHWSIPGSWTKMKWYKMIRDRKKSFRNFFKIMLPTGLHFPGPHESIALWSDAKFEREHAFRN